jgi:Uma2 family endonuclease
VFDEPNRLELIHGDLREKEKVNPPHAIATVRTARRFRTLFEPSCCVREEKPVHLDFDGEPVPDVLVAEGNDESYAAQHPAPQNVRLLVEVADSSVTYDTGDKAFLYAHAGIADYWVLLVNPRELLIYRNPTPDGYRGEPQRLHESDIVSPLFAPDVTIAVADLLPPPSRPDSDAA